MPRGSHVGGSDIFESVFVRGSHMGHLSATVTSRVRPPGTFMSGQHDAGCQARSAISQMQYVATAVA